MKNDKDKKIKNLKDQEINAEQVHGGKRAKPIHLEKVMPGKMKYEKRGPSSFSSKTRGDL